MARELDMSQPLTEEDVEYLRQRHPEPYVARMVELAGAEDDEGDEPDVEVTEDDDEGGESAEQGSEAPEPTEDDDDAESGDDDLIGAPEYDPLVHTTQEVRKYMKDASEDEVARVIKVEQDRTDREARTSITSYTAS